MRIFLSVGLLLIGLTLLGQENLNEPTIIERYPGGADTLRKYIAKNARFPESAAETGRSGLSVASITITPEGIIDNAAIFNSLSEDIDTAVTDLLYTTEGQWLPSKDYPLNQTFYFQISFDFEASKDLERINVHGDSILEEIRIAVMGYTPSNYKTIDQLERNLERSLKKENYNQALEILDELIRREPFNVLYYESQAKCYDGLKKPTAKAEVEGRIQEYHIKNGLSLLKKPVLYGNIKIIDPLKNGTFSIKELNRDSTIIYSGRLISVNPEVRQGKFYFFGNEGKVNVTGEYQNDVPVGVWNYFDQEGNVIRALDYSSVVKFLLEEDANPLIDSFFLNLNDPLVNPDGSFAIAETMPLFNGKDPASEFRKYLIEQINYPIFAKIKRIEGRVVVQFTVDKEGRVREPVIVRGSHVDLNLEALRIIINSPEWTPGEVEGRKVNVVFTFPVDFSLGKGFDLMDLFL